MKKFLITGFNGFVSRHFINFLEANDIRSEVLGIDVNKLDMDYSGLKNVISDFVQLDLLEHNKLENLLLNFQPEYILHLASYSSVGFSWKNPSLSFRNNINIFLNLMEVLREVNPSCRILSVGSSEEYGNVTPEKIPLREDYTLAPVSPYAVARVSQEFLSKVYCDGYGLDIVMTRSFNHIGPGQKDIFVISSFAKQLIEIKKGIKNEPKLVTGDISIIRDFLDVRDVVEAYYLLLTHGEGGEVYNVCSSCGTSLNEIINIMCEILEIEVQAEMDRNLLRPNDNMIIIGSNEKIKKLTGWQQKISLKNSLKDVIEYWNDRI